MSSRAITRVLPCTKAALRPQIAHSIIPKASIFAPQTHALRNLPTRTMTLAPRWPHGEFTSLFRLLDDYNDHITTRAAGTAVRTFAPKFDVRETKDAYILDGELPGIAQKDIDIEFTDPHTLVIKGKTEREYAVPRADEKHPEYRYWVTERSIGEFNRTFSFPARIDQDKVKAKLENGVLSVTIPKAAGPTQKKVTVE